MVRQKSKGESTPVADDKSKTEGAESATEGEEGKAKKGLGLVPMIAAAVVTAGVAGGAAFVLAPAAPEINYCQPEGHEGDGAHGEAGANASGHDNDAHDGDHGAGADGHKAGDAAADGAHGEGEEPACVPLPDDHGGEEKKKSDKKKADKGHGGGHGGGDHGEEAAVVPLKPIGTIQQSEETTFLVLDPMIISIQPIGRSKHLKVSLVFETDEDGAAALLNNGFYIQDVLNTFLRSVDSTILEDPSAMARLRSQILRRVKSVAPDANVTNVLITEFVLT